jgi:hypothetical protein
MSSSDNAVRDPDFEEHQKTYRIFVTVFSLVILGHFVAASLVAVGLFSSAGWGGGILLAVVEIAVIAAVWRLLKKTGAPSRA